MVIYIILHEKVWFLYSLADALKTVIDILHEKFCIIQNAKDLIKLYNL